MYLCIAICFNKVLHVKITGTGSASLAAHAHYICDGGKRDLDVR